MAGIVKKVLCPHCGSGGKFNWKFWQVTATLVGGGTTVYFIWECLKCATRLLHLPFGW